MSVVVVTERLWQSRRERSRSSPSRAGCCTTERRSADMGEPMDSTLAALLGAIIGGVLSVVASRLAQRVQSRSQWLAQEVARRQQLYSEFLDAAVCCYGDALEHDEVDM